MVERKQLMDIAKQLATFVSVAMALSFLTADSLLFAFADDQYARDTLRGLRGVYVAVEGLSAEIEEHGLTIAMLKADTELKLRVAGIKVLSKEEWVKTEGGPVCYVEVTIVKDVILTHALDLNLYAFEVSVALNQDVVPVRDTAVTVLSPTWSTSYLGITNSLPRIRSKVKEMVERFINAYLAVNPN